MNKWLVTIMALWLVAGFAQAAGDVEAGKTKSAVCASCHGADGNSVNPTWPKLAEQHEKYIKKQLHNFKDGSRKDPLMSAQAAALTDQDIEDLAAYFSAQRVQVGTAAEDKIVLGESIYRGGNTQTGVSACIACHGPTGIGNASANFPSLSGQHAAYVVKQLTDFSNDSRSNDPGQMMRDISHNMSKEEMESVAQYVQGLK